MSNINGLEPQAFGLIVFKTTFGELELELFTKQCPKATKNFVQLCLDGYYNGTIFPRVEKDFIAIGGKLDANNEDDPGDKIVTQTFPDEFHSRLKFSRRGLLATANTDKDRNGPEFFFTLGPAPELQNKHTIFGRLRGNSVYCLVDLNDCPVDDDLLPLSEKKVLEAIVVENPYPDLEARPEIIEKLKNYREKPTQHDSDEDRLEPKFDIKNSKKLSFYHDSDDDDDDIEDKHDNNADTNARDKIDTPIDVNVVNKLNDSIEQSSPTKQISGNQSDEGGEGYEPVLSKEEAREKRLREIREQIQNIKKQFENESATKIRTLSDRRKSKEQDSSTSDNKSNSSKQSIVEDPDFNSTQELKLAPKKGRHRERETLELMQKFKKKLKESTASPKLNKASTSSVHDDPAVDDEIDLIEALEKVDGDAWLRHRFDAGSDGSDRLAKDANQKGDDWYSIDDPRNPMIKRIEADSVREYKRSQSSSKRKLDDYDHRSRSSRKERRHHHHHHR